MAITDPYAVSFSNTKVRVAADKLAQAYYFAKRVQNEWNANGVSGVITNDSSVVVDGSATDGRHQITGAQATNVISRLGELINWMERGTLDASGSPTNSYLNTVLDVSVNNS